MNDLGRRGGCTFWLGPSLLIVLSIATAVAANAMGDNIAGQLLDQVQQWFSDKWSAIFDPIYFWYFLLAVLIIVLGLITWFVPFKIVRLIAGIIIFGAIAFVAGGRTMGQRNRAKLQSLREQLAAEKAKRNQRSNGNTGGGWFGNWN